MEDKHSNEKRSENIISSIIENDRILWIIVLIGLLGIVFIFVSTYIRPSDSKDNNQYLTENNMLKSYELDSYRNTISEELGSMLASMQGVGRTKVMITMDGSSRSIYATDIDLNDRETSRKNGDDENVDKQSIEKKSCIVIRQKDGSEKALAVGQLLPKVKGVLIICDGGDNLQVKNNIIDAVSVALDISNTHICVSKLG